MFETIWSGQDSLLYVSYELKCVNSGNMQDIVVLK